MTNPFATPWERHDDGEGIDDHHRLKHLVDAVTMQAMDMLLAFPSLILGLMLVAMLGPSMLAAIALTSLPTFARIARAPTIAMKGRDFIEACRSLRFSDTRILCGHILPNIFPEILV